VRALLKPLKSFTAIGLTALVVIALTGWAKILISPSSINSDLMKVLPESSPLISHVRSSLSKMVGQKLLIGFASKSQIAAELAAQKFITGIETSNKINVVNPVDEKIIEYLDSAGPYYTHLLDETDRSNLKEGNYLVYKESFQQHLHGFPSEWRALPTSEDPWNLFGRFISALSPKNQVESYDQYLILDHQQTKVSLITLSARETELPINDIVEIETQINALIEQIESTNPNIRTMKSGALFHIAKATTDAKKEVTLISITSIILIAGLFLYTFRTIRPLAFALSSIVIGTFISFPLTFLVFGHLHVLTLVFGTSLIGVGVDYALHFICSGDSARRSSLRTTSLIAVFSTGVAYFFLLGTNLPIMKEIAVFAAIGLFACWIFTILAFPIFFSRAVTIKGSLFQLIVNEREITSQNSNNKKHTVYILIVILFSIWTLLTHGSVDKSIRSLYQPDNDLITSDREVAQLLKSSEPNLFFLLKNNDIQVLLENLEKTKPWLRSLMEAELIENFQLITDYLPSMKTQAINKDLIADIYGSEGKAYQSINMLSNTERELKTKIMSSANNYLNSTTVNEIATLTFPHLWIGQLEDEYIVRIELIGIKSHKAIKELQLPDELLLVDFLDGWANELARGFKQTILTLVLSIVVIVIWLYLWTRRLNSILIALIPIASSLFALAIFSLWGAEITIFHLFGIYLVIGLGLDYGVFMYKESRGDSRCRVAVLLSAMTTLAAFGLLSLTSTPMISYFGKTIFIGIISNMLLIFLVRNTIADQPPLNHVNS